MKKQAQKSDVPEMHSCPLCGYETDEGGSFCPICGEEYKEYK